MKSIFNKADQNEIIKRIDSLDQNSKAAWGKMSVEQMVKHCILCEDYYFGNVAVKRALLGRIIGKMAIRGILKPGNTLLRKNAPSVPAFLVTGPVTDLDSQKRTWKSLIERYDSFTAENFTHWFFGKMTKEQLGQFIYIHCNHHLTQFNA